MWCHEGEQLCLFSFLFFPFFFSFLFSSLIFLSFPLCSLSLSFQNLFRCTQLVFPMRKMRGTEVDKPEKKEKREKITKDGYDDYFGFCWKVSWGMVQAWMMMTMMLSFVYFCCLLHSNHDDDGCCHEGRLASKKSISTTQLLVGF